MDDTQGNAAPAPEAAAQIDGGLAAKPSFAEPVASVTAPQPQPQPTQAAAQPQPTAAPAAPAAEAYVLDTTATALNPVRNHEQVMDGAIKVFTFHHGKPLPMSWPAAIRFLRHEAFKLTDKDGNLREYQHRPKQPDELGAGERFKLGEDEVVARYGELSIKALYARTLELPGGEQFQANAFKSEAEARTTMVGFIKKMKKQMAEANKSQERDVGADAFVPAGESTNDFDD
jgi:hypothetical protein